MIIDSDWGPPVMHWVHSPYVINNCMNCGADSTGMFIDDSSDVFVGCTACHYRSISVPGGYDTLAVINWNQNKGNHSMNNDQKPVVPKGNFFTMGTLWGTALYLNSGRAAATLDGKIIKSIELPTRINLESMQFHVHLDDGSTVTLSNAQLRQVELSEDNGTYTFPASTEEDIYDSATNKEIITIAYI